MNHKTYEVDTATGASLVTALARVDFAVGGRCCASGRSAAVPKGGRTGCTTAGATGVGMAGPSSGKLLIRSTSVRACGSWKWRKRDELRTIAG